MAVRAIPLAPAPAPSLLVELYRVVGRTAEEIERIYREYKEKHQSDLTLPQFALLYSLKQDRRLVFNRTKLVYQLMCEDSKTLSLESFRRFAPALVTGSSGGTPFVTKLNVERVFRALLVDEDLGILFKEFETWIQAHRDQENSLPLIWPNAHKHLPLDPLAGKPELLVSRGRTVELSGAVPTLGKLLLSSTCVMFESSMFKNRQIFTYNQIRKLELRTSSSFFGKRAGVRLTVQDKPTPAKPSVYLWDFPSISPASESANERHRTFVYIRDLMIAHRLVRAEPDKTTACFVLKEIGQTTRAMRALEAVEGADPLSLSPLHDQARLLPRQRAAEETKVHAEDEVFAPDEEQTAAGARRQELEQQFLERVRNEIKRQRSIRDSKSPWLFKVLPGLQAEARQDELKADVDPEYQVDVVEAATNVKAVRDKFSVKEFRYQVQLFRHQLEVLFIAAAAYRALKSWDYPALSAFTLLFLLNLAYQDLLSYLPALFILCNTVLLLLLRSNPQLFASDPRDLPADRSPPESAGSGSGDAAAAGGSGKGPRKGAAAGKEDSHGGGIFSKVRGYYVSAVAAKDGLESAQNSLAEINEQFMKIEGLYKWFAEAPSTQFLIYNIVGFLAMAFLPFRVVFPLIVIDVFTSKWQRPGSALSRLLARVPLPKERIEF